MLFLLFGILKFSGFSETVDETSIKSDYLSFQTGFMVNEYNSLGVRTFLEYQKAIKKNYHYGISYEHTRHIGFVKTDQLHEYTSNLNQLSINGYYTLNLIRDRLFWLGGIGVGIVHVTWNDIDAFGATVNASLTLNVRITKKIYLEFAPLIVLFPVNRYYYSPMNSDYFDNFYAFTLLPFGIKVKL